MNFITSIQYPRQSVDGIIAGSGTSIKIQDIGKVMMNFKGHVHALYIFCMWISRTIIDWTIAPFMVFSIMHTIGEQSKLDAYRSQSVTSINFNMIIFVNIHNIK